jgi:YbgC/YbaW family acyl-CoA thioester hydrolase
MTEVKLRVYWADCDPAGLVYFGNFFRLIGQAEEELYLRAMKNREKLFEGLSVWMPRVEVHANFLSPIRSGRFIRVRLNPEFKGDKTVRLGFEVLDDETSTLFATGYVTVVCVDRATFKSRPIPDEIRQALNAS